MHYPIIERHSAAATVISSLYSMPQELIEQRLRAIRARNYGGLTSSMFCSKICIALDSWLAGDATSIWRKVGLYRSAALSTPLKAGYSRLASENWLIDRPLFRWPIVSGSAIKYARQLVLEKGRNEL